MIENYFDLVFEKRSKKWKEKNIEVIRIAHSILLKMYLAKNPSIIAYMKCKYPKLKERWSL